MEERYRLCALMNRQKIRQHYLGFEPCALVQALMRWAISSGARIDPRRIYSLGWGNILSNQSEAHRACLICNSQGYLINTYEVWVLVGRSLYVPRQKARISPKARELHVWFCHDAICFILDKAAPDIWSCPKNLEGLLLPSTPELSPNSPKSRWGSYRISQALVRISCGQSKYECGMKVLNVVKKESLSRCLEEWAFVWDKKCKAYLDPPRNQFFVSWTGWRTLL